MIVPNVVTRPPARSSLRSGFTTNEKICEREN